MKKFNINDIEIEVFTDTNRDGDIYGNAADFDEIRKFNEEDILESLEIYFPWGEELDIEEYFHFINQTIFQEYPELLTQSDSYLIDMQITHQANSIYDIIIQFPHREDPGMDYIIEEIFDFCDVPKGTIYEDALPVELQFWPQYNYDDDYELYRKTPFGLENHKKTIESISNKLKEFDDPIIIKSLILSALSTSEYVLKSLIVNQVSNMNSTHTFVQDIFKESFNKKLRGSVDELRGMFKKLYGKDAPTMDWTPIRNALAHEMENTDIYGDIIKYKNLKTKITEECSIEDIIQKQRDFNKELTDITISYSQ